MIHVTMRASREESLANYAVRYTRSEVFLLACAEGIAMDKFQDEIRDDLFCLVEW